MSNLAEYLPKLPFYSNLSLPERSLVLDNWIIKTYKKGQIIYSTSEVCVGHIFMCSGEIRAYINSEQGREITLFRLFPNDTCVLSAACVINQINFDTQMVAVEDTTVLIITPGIFKRLTEQNIYVKCYMYELLSARFSSVMGTMQQIVFMGYDKRLAIFLLKEYERTGSKTIKMTHEQIAERTNSAREVVARMLKKFASKGLLNYKRGSIEISDINSLNALLN